MTQRTLPACCLAELLGTFLLVLLGCGAVHVAVLMGDLSGLWQVGIVWGIAIMLAAYVCGPISGAHINPAITVGLAVWGMFPWRRVAAYIASQLSGAFLAAAVLFCLFHPFLAAKEEEKGVTRGEPGSVVTAMCYGEYFPNPGGLAAAEGELTSKQLAEHWGTFGQLPACLAEVVGTMILALVVAAVSEPKNKAMLPGLAPVFVGLTVASLICVLAPLTQACFNPARDLGPRLFTAVAGWGAAAIPGPNATGFVTVYILSPLIGGILGIGLYRRLLRPAVVQEEES